ncbi:MAG TPA: 50S ribosomal protein L25/general stress protein Ctc [Thermodesulfobacteriota bacterium]
MQRTEMTAQVRRQMGKGAARQVRREGQIPAVLYGRGTSPVALSVSPQALRGALATGGANALITLKIEGDGASGATKVVMLKDVQTDPVRRTWIHADLYEVRMDETITVEVPVRIVGKAEGVKTGGILETVLRSVTVECLPGQIPDVFEVDVTPLAVGQSIHVGDLKLPEGVRLRTPAGDTLVTVIAPQAEAAPTPEEQEAALKASLAGPEGEAKGAGASGGGAKPAGGGKK